MQKALIASVRSGAVVGDGSHAVITFEVADGAWNVAIPAPEVTSLLTLCVGLSAQTAAQRGGEEAHVLPVDDWQIGRTASGAVILRLTSEGGASLMYRFERQQALELRDAIAMAAAGPPLDAAERRARDPAAQASSPHLSELAQLREQCRDHPSARELVDRCIALLAELDAANDEGRAVYRKNLVELVSAAKAHLRSIEALPPLEVERPPPAAG